MPECPLKYVCVPGLECENCLKDGTGYIISKQFLSKSAIPLAYAPTSYNPVPQLKEYNYDLKQYAKNLVTRVSQGEGLYLWSKHPGTGKTSIACLLLLKELKHTWYSAVMEDIRTPVLYLNTVELMDKLRSSMNRPDEDFTDLWDEQFTNRAPKLLLLDDIGAEKPSEWVRERLYSLINYRVSNRLATIFTSNCPPTQLEEQVGPRIASRIFATSNLVLQLEEIDRRRTNGC